MTFSRLATALFGFIFASSLAIGTAHAAPAETPEMVVAVYGVADLVIPLDSAQGSKTTEESLMTLVRNLVDPASWEDQGGEANVQFYPVGYGLVVRQTAENQETVAKVLDDLRNIKNHTSAPDLGVPINSGGYLCIGSLPAMIYDVSDLVGPAGASVEKGKWTEEMLKSLICRLVDPESWHYDCGSACVEFCCLGSSMVVRQSFENQDKVAKVLTQLRRLRDRKVGASTTPSYLFEVEDQPTLAAEKPHIVGEIFITGNDLTQSDHILSFVDIYPGEPLNYPALRQIEIKLARSGLFDTQDRPTLTVIDRDDGGESEFKDILISVKEDKSISASMVRLLWKTKETLSSVKELVNYCTNEILGCFIDFKNLDIAPTESESEKVEDPKLTTRIYPVADLVYPIQNSKSLQIELDNARWKRAIDQQLNNDGMNPRVAYPHCFDGISPMPCVKPPLPCGQQTLEEQLIQLISRAIDPQSWSYVGGPASIQYYPIGNALVVNQTDANQEQIAELLASLRKLQEVEVAVEMRLVSVSREFAAQVMSEGGYPGTLGADGGISLDLPFLTDVQVQMFLEAAQGDRRTNVMQAPKITIFNGQTGNINVGEEVEVIGVDFEQVNGESIPLKCNTRVPYGVFMTTTPVVSEDRQHVRSHFTFVKTLIYGNDTGKPSVESLTLDKVIDLGDGQTALFHLGKMTEDARQEKVRLPLLHRVPYLNRLFGQVGYQPLEREVFLMVTTQVIVNEEEAPEFRGELQPRIPR